MLGIGEFRKVTVAANDSITPTLGPQQVSLENRVTEFFTTGMG